MRVYIPFKKIVVLSISFNLFSCTSPTENSDKEFENFKDQESLSQTNTSDSTTKNQTEFSEDEVLKKFQGTFTITEIGKHWYKFTIENKEVTLWSSSAQGGEWGEPEKLDLFPFTLDGKLIYKSRTSEGKRTYGINFKAGTKILTGMPALMIIWYCPNCDPQYWFEYDKEYPPTFPLKKVAADYTPWD